MRAFYAAMGILDIPYFVIYLYTSEHNTTTTCNKFFGFVFNPFLCVNALEALDILYFLQNTNNNCTK